MSPAAPPPWSVRRALPREIPPTRGTRLLGFSGGTSGLPARSWIASSVSRKHVKLPRHPRTEALRGGGATTCGEPDRHLAKMPLKKGPATPRGSPKKKASPAASHRTGPWVIGARDAKTAPDAVAAPVNKKHEGPTYDPDLFAICTPPSSRHSSPARSPKQLRGAEHPDAYDFHRLVRAKIQGSALPEGITASMVSEDAKVRSTTPPRTAATSTAASSTLGLTAAQPVAHEAARLNDPYAAADAQAAAAPSVVSSGPYSEPAQSPGARRYAKAMRALGDERQRCKGCDSYFCEIAGCASPWHYENGNDVGDDGGVSPTQPFTAPKTVRFADTFDIDTPCVFDPDAEHTGTVLPARSCRPAGTPMYNAHSLYIPHPDSAPYGPAEQDDQDPQPDDAQRPETPTDEAEQLLLTSGPPAALGPSPGTLIQDLAGAMGDMEHSATSAPASATSDADMLHADADMPSTFVASPPVETVSPTGSVGGICVSMPSTDPREKIDPWTQLTAYEQADGWDRQDAAGPSTTPAAPAAAALLSPPGRRPRTPPASTPRSRSCSATSPRRSGPSARTSANRRRRRALH